MKMFEFNLERSRGQTANPLTTLRVKPGLFSGIRLFNPKLQKLVALLIVVTLLAVSVQGDGRSEYGLPRLNRAIYLGWQGYVDTQLDFSQFLNADHTIMAWFMPQYPYAYEGPIFAENGSGIYAIGQGDYREGDGGFGDPGNPVFRIEIGNKKVKYLVPEFKESSLKVHPWVHIAVVRRNNIFRLFVNGTQRMPVKNIDKVTNTSMIDSQIDASTILPSWLPSGTLRLGRRTSGQYPPPGSAEENIEDPKRDWQAYGLLDDVAVLNQGLSASQIQAIMNQKRLSGSETGLIAGWCFDKPAPTEKPLPPLLNSWFDPSARAYYVPASVDRDGDHDDHQFDNPLIIGETQVELNLPIPVNEEWYVVQGYNDAGGSHNGTAAFSYDLRHNGGTQEYPNGTAHAPVLASATGQAVLYLKSEPPDGGQDQNFVTLKQAQGEYVRYLHLAPNSIHAAVSGGIYNGDYYVIPENQAPTIQQGDQIGTVGPTSVHVHWAGKAGSRTPVTIPMAFANYEVWDEANQIWAHVFRGHPKAGQVIRRLQ